MARAKTKLDKLLAEHSNLTHSEECKVASHSQRHKDEWYINTLMIEGYDVPFIFKRKRKYKTLTGALVNLTYYPDNKDVAGIIFETMKVVRVKVA